MPQRRLTSRVLGVLLAVALVTPAATRSETPAGWQRTDLRPITQPLSAGGLFVMYASRAGALEVVAVDPATARTVWTQPASPSDITPGETASLMVVGDTVIYLARSIEDSAKLTAADARTGAPRWQTADGFFTTWPGECPGTPPAVCISGGDALGLDAGEFRFDLVTGRRLPFARIGLDGGREIGVGLLDPGDRDPERLVSVRGARITWSRPLERVFPRASTDSGWIIDRFDALRLYVGTIEPRLFRRRGRDVLDLGLERTAGFRIADGVVAWRTRGAYQCGVTVPCPGQAQGAAEVGSDVPTVGVRMVSTGTFSARAGSSADFRLSPDVTARLEGFSPTSGRTLWRFALGDARAVLNGGELLPQAGLSTVVVRDARRRLRALELATGARTAIAATAPVWCERPIQYRQTIGFGTDDETLHDYTGGAALVPCAAGTHRRLPTPAGVPAFVRALGTTAAGLVAWADTTGLFARPIAP